MSVEVQALLPGRWFDGSSSQGEDVLVGALEGLLATHPDTAERAERLGRGAAPSCP